MKMRRIWIGLAVLLLANYLLLLVQTASVVWQWRQQMPVGHLFPEARYWLQGAVVFLPLVPMALLRFRHGRKILGVLLILLVVHAVCFLAKAHVPGTRRNRSISACDWAVERIRADYRGPKADSEPFFTWLEYHPLSRPCVDAHVMRVGYLLGGRGASATACGRVDIPDYIVGEPQKLDRDWWCVAEYEKFAEKPFGPRNFVIYKRVR